MTESPTPTFGGPDPEAGHQLLAPEPEAAPARTIKPLYLVGGAVAALALLGGVGYAVLAASSQEPAAVAQPTMAPGASVSSTTPSPLTEPSPGASTLDIAPVVLATRDPFTAKPTAATGTAGTGTTGATANDSTTTATVTTTSTATVTATKRVTPTVTKTVPTTVTATPTYVFVASVSGAQATLVVNGSVPVTLNAGESTSGVTFVLVDPANPSTCAMVERTGAAGGGTSVCEGRSLQLS